MAKWDEDIYKKIRQTASEFIITHHARERIIERTNDYINFRSKQRIIESYYLGTKPPKGFKRNQSERLMYFDRYQYKYHLGYIFIWGIKNLTGKKTLVTVYNWDNK